MALSAVAELAAAVVVGVVVAELAAESVEALVTVVVVGELAAE